MVNRMRHTRAHTANRRSHHKLVAASFVLCDKCGQPKEKHVVCRNCGFYKGREVLKMEAKAAKTAKREKASAKK